MCRPPRIRRPPSILWQVRTGNGKPSRTAGLAIAEAASLLTVPGRKCSNGRAVPIGNADWPKLVQGLRDAGMAAYKAAQAKNQDKILDAADVMTTACANCHEKYREKPSCRCSRSLQVEEKPGAVVFPDFGR